MGGLEKLEINPLFKELKKGIESILQFRRVLRGYIEGHNLFIDSLQRNSLGKGDIIEYGLSGPCLRSTGINRDLRRDKPYYLYRELDFAVPLASNGGCLDRVLVMLEETYQSCRIMTELIDNLPLGDWVITQESSEKSKSFLNCAIEFPHGEVGVTSFEGDLLLNLPSRKIENFINSAQYEFEQESFQLFLLTCGFNSLERGVHDLI
jgi:Ni,Fe-hydrogenase III large subunit